jgi:hypothetical protein
LDDFGQRDFLLGACLETAAIRGAETLDELLAETWTLFTRLTNPAVRMRAALTISTGAGQVVSSQTADTANGATMAATMTDIQVADTSVMVDDAAGVVLSDNLTWAFDDGGAILTPVVSPDTHSCHYTVTQPVTLGTVTVTVSDPEAPQLAPFVEQITVTPSVATSIQGSTTVSDAPPPGP